MFEHFHYGKADKVGGSHIIDKRMTHLGSHQTGSNPTRCSESAGTFCLTREARLKRLGVVLHFPLIPPSPSSRRWCSVVRLSRLSFCSQRALQSINSVVDATRHSVETERGKATARVEVGIRGLSTSVWLERRSLLHHLPSSYKPQEATSRVHFPSHYLHCRLTTTEWRSGCPRINSCS